MRLRALLFLVIFLQSFCAWALSPVAHRLCVVDVFRQLGYSDDVVEILAQANRSVDATKEFDNPASHFDSERLADGSALLRRRIQHAVTKLTAGDVNGARIELGKATHAVQDFFSHSNYVDAMEGRPVDLLNLRNPPTGIGCEAANRKAILVTGYYPDNKVPQGKCSHSQLNKDDFDRPHFFKVLKYAKIHTAKLAYEFERRVIARNPARGRQLLAKFKDADHPPAPRSQSYRFDMASDAYPDPIAPNWSGVFPGGADKRVRIKDKIYFSRGDYIRYDIRADRADSGDPKKFAAE